MHKRYTYSNWPDPAPQSPAEQSRQTCKQSQCAISVQGSLHHNVGPPGWRSACTSPWLPAREQCWCFQVSPLPSQSAPGARASKSRPWASTCAWWGAADLQTQQQSTKGIAHNVGTDRLRTSAPLSLEKSSMGIHMARWGAADLRRQHEQQRHMRPALHTAGKFSGCGQQCACPCFEGRLPLLLIKNRGHSQTRIAQLKTEYHFLGCGPGWLCPCSAGCPPLLQ
jgi:hypothetical protein